MTDKTKNLLNRIETILVSVYGIIWIVVMSLRCGSDSFWEDEGFTIWLSRMSIPDMLEATGNDVHPPLYYLCVKFFVTVMGESPLAFRITSILTYALIVCVALTIVRRLWSAGGAFLMITLLSLLHNSSVLAVEARMYELALLLILLAFLSARMIMTDGSVRYLVIYGIAVAGAAYTHYYALVTAAIMSASLLLYVLIFDRAKTRAVIITELLAVLSYCPWAIVLYRTFRNYKDDYWIQSIPTFMKCMREIYRSDTWLEYMMLIITAAVMAAVCVIYVQKRSAALSDARPTSDTAAGPSSAAPAMAGSSPYAGTHGAENTTVSQDIFWMIIGLLSVIGTALAGITVSLIFRPLFYERYMYPSVIIAWVILIYCLSRIRAGRLISYILAVIIFITCIRTYLYRVDTEKAWDASNEKVIKWIEDETEGRPLVIYEPGAATDKLLMYYLPGMDYADTGHLLKLAAMDRAVDEDGIIYITAGADPELTKSLTEGEVYRVDGVMEDCVLGQTRTDIYILHRKGS